MRGLAVLVASTPCPLILAAPVAFIAGVSRAARHGILIKGGGPLEALARVHTILFDKTGTLTAGGARLAAVETAPGENADEVLRLAASLGAGLSSCRRRGDRRLGAGARLDLGNPAIRARDAWVGPRRHYRRPSHLRGLGIFDFRQPQAARVGGPGTKARLLALGALRLCRKRRSRHRGAAASRRASQGNAAGGPGSARRRRSPDGHGDRRPRRRRRDDQRCSRSRYRARRPLALWTRSRPWPPSRGFIRR